MRPIEIAKCLCRAKGGVFEDDLCRYLGNEHATLVMMPACFVMAQPIVLEDGRHAWFVEMAVGRLRELLSLMPFPLPFIAFHRRDDKQLRVYPLTRFSRHSSLVTLHSL